MSLLLTASQTVGPFGAISFETSRIESLAPAGVSGERITLRGRVLTNNNGAFQLTTIKPGRVPGPGGILQAPHLVAVVFMRGLLKHLVTRIYFPGEPGNADDPILKLVPAERRATLIAKKIAAERGVLEWNVILQGKDETVFFDY